MLCFLFELSSLQFLITISFFSEFSNQEKYNFEIYDLRDCLYEETYPD